MLPIPCQSGVGCIQHSSGCDDHVCRANPDGEQTSHAFASSSFRPAGVSKLLDPGIRLTPSAILVVLSCLQILCPARFSRKARPLREIPMDDMDTSLPSV